MKSLYHHFAKIASRYTNLRTTDLEPIIYTKKKLQKLKSIKAVDVGCGNGRYSLNLLKCLGDKLHLHCIDVNPKMLEQLHARFDLFSIYLLNYFFW